MKYPLPKDTDRVSLASCCSSAFQALLWYGPLTIAEIRWINEATFTSWSIGLLGCVIDCGLNLDKRMDAKVIGTIVEDGGVVADRIRIVDNGKMIGELIEKDSDGDFRCLRKRKEPDAF